MRKAVIDIGSNSVLLLVEERRGSNWETIVETTSVTSLGEGTKVTGLLSREGMNRTLSALRAAFRTAKEAGCDEIVAAATMAARIARNTPEFLAEAARQETPVTVLTGDEEAELGLLAVLGDPAFDEFHRVSIVDVGGQSTELVTADHGAVLFRRSYSVGTLGLRGGSLAGERLGPREFLQGVREIDDVIGLEFLPGACGVAVALGATGTNLVTMREQMREWQPWRVHKQWLDFQEVSKAVSWLGSMSDAERAQVVGMEPGRERTLHLGALILERFLHCLHTPGCFVSVRGWRHALLEQGLPA